MKEFKKKKDNKKTAFAVRKENREQGIIALQRHPLFGSLGGQLCVCQKTKIGSNAAAITCADGVILLNEDVLLAPGDWAYAIAHCMLHLAFGHFDASHLPGYEKADAKGNLTHQPLFQASVWNDACDIYISRFLSGIRFDQSAKNVFSDLLPQSLQGELQIYQYLLEHPSLCASAAGRFGTAAPGQMDMRGLEHPLVYQKDARFHTHNRYAAQFAFALSHSVSDAVAKAGSAANQDAAPGFPAANGMPKTAPSRAARFFIDSYPLLGGLAAAFRLIEDCRFCQQNEIKVAAVDADAQEIYVNPACSLSEDEWRFVLAHEYLHAGLCHLSRREGRNAFLWNAACDYVVNGWLMEMEIGTPPDGLLYDEKLKNESAESIYDLLCQNLRESKKLETFRGYGKGDLLEPSFAKPLKGSSSGRLQQGLPDFLSVDEFCKNALRQGLDYMLASANRRGLLPYGLAEEIRALSVPPVPWDVALARWFDQAFPSLEQRRSYALPSRRQSATPDIPRPRSIPAPYPEGRTFGVVVDTSGSMDAKLLGMALGAIASYAEARSVPLVRVVFCDACAYDAGYLSPADIAGRCKVYGRGGTVLQPGIDCLMRAPDFPKDGPVLIITDGMIESRLSIPRKHAFLIPRGARLPFPTKAPLFRMEAAFQ